MTKSEFYVRALSNIKPNRDIVSYVHTRIHSGQKCGSVERRDILVEFFAEYIKSRTKSINWYYDQIRSTEMAKKLLLKNEWDTKIMITKKDLEKWLDDELRRTSEIANANA